MTHALVVGGGIAGTVAALALHKAGFDVTVFEAFPAGGDDAGAFLTVGANGMLALAQVDATAPVVDAAFPLTALELTDGDGKRLGKVPLRGPDPAMPGHHHLRRADLYRVLQTEALRRGIEVEHGKRLTSARNYDDAVDATFADGSHASGDLVVGADGLRSTVRAIVDPGGPPPRYAGQRVFYGYTADAAPHGDQATMHMVRGRKAAFGYTISPAGETWWFARVPGAPLGQDELADTDPTGWREQLMPLFRRDSTPAADIVEHTGDELIADNIHDLPDVANWYAGRMLVIGDAAHAASPASGQGASMALEDAVMLAKALRDLPDHATAFAAYERLRRARVDRIVTGGAQLTRSKLPGPIRRALRNRRAKRDYARRRPDDRNWLYDYPLDWHTPVTPELAAATDAAQRPSD